MKTNKAPENLSRNYTRAILSSPLLSYFIIFVLILINIFLVYLLLQQFGLFKSEEVIVKKDPIDRSKIQLEVLNGCGVSGVADKFSEILREEGFDVVNIGNYRSFNVENSLLISRTGDEEKDELVSSSLMIDQMKIVEHINPDYYLDLTFVIGRDYNELLNNMKGKN